MMRALGAILWVFVVLMVWSGFTQSAEENMAAPVIEVKMPTYKFDQLTQVEVVKHEFQVFNRGSAPLEIKNVKSGWGCSVARFDRTIPPGGEGKITLQVRTKGYQGNIHKTARVLSNDPKHPQVTIGIEGKVFVPIHMDLQYVVLKGAIGEKIERAVHLRAEKEEPLIIKLDSVSIPDKVAVEVNEIEKGRAYELKVRNKVQKKGRYGGHVKLVTNYPEKPEIMIRISGHIAPPVECRPKVLSFGRMPEERLMQLKTDGRSVYRPVVVLLHKGNDLKIEKVELEKSLFRVVTSKVLEGRTAQLLVEPIFDKLKKGPNTDRLKIYTNQKGHEVLEVSVRFEIL